MVTSSSIQNDSNCNTNDTRREVHTHRHDFRQSEGQTQTNGGLHGQTVDARENDDHRPASIEARLPLLSRFL